MPPDLPSPLTKALSDNPMLLPLMAHCEPLQRRGRSFNKDLPWMRVAERYRIVARTSDVPEHDAYRNPDAYRWQGFKNGFLNLVASFVVATLQLMNTEALIGCVVTIVSVTAYWTYGQYLAAHMNWSIVSLAVVFPITQACTIRAWQRPHNAPLPPPCACAPGAHASTVARAHICTWPPRSPPPRASTTRLHHAGHRHGLPAAGAGAARPLAGARP